MEKILMIKGNDVEIVKKAVSELGSFKVIELTKKGVQPKSEPEVMPGTCSDCPHFISMRNAYDRGGVVSWGNCKKYGGAAVNEHKKHCRARIEELPKLYVYREGA